ncbi:MAG: hypothetical protein HOC91_17225 [Nitrospinaceae bacterium]|nr:hypothetical protein [Nitrospinaceae bacterium]MBT3434320.1 hypothetical protein [Nitrospinaceae bacterium]MBT3820092.1 hypothetical protein [Nitrospinaceae bacterium]MBT4432254.1 hypothetical protein [Nitrospinaceae bacterium]MBT5368803.1 hypothetical protein [Nitrospinaceae bacterium]
MPIDRGIWATWYDLPEGGRTDFLSWLHEIHLPEVAQRPGYLWAGHYEIADSSSRMNRVKDKLTYTDLSDVGGGTQFLVLRGAASPHVFCDPNPAQLVEHQSAEVGEMLGRRIGVRSCIFAEEARVDGPEVRGRAPGLTPGPAIQMGSFVANSLEAELDLGAWYAQYRLPSMGRMPGCVGARKLVSIAGWAKHSILYEFTSLDAREENFQKHEELSIDEKEWSGKVIRYLTHAPGSPSVGRRIWPAAR